MRPLVALTVCLAIAACGSAQSVARPIVLAPKPDCSNCWITTNLKPDRDYKIVLGSKPRRCALTVQGGHDITVKGGAISIPWQHDVGHENISKHYGIYLVDQTGEVRIEGVRLGGPDLIVPIVLNEGKGAKVTIRSVRAVLHSHWRNIRTAHGDCIQTWRGPKILDVDRFTCGTDYFFLQLQPLAYVCGSRMALQPPCDVFEADVPIRFSFRRINDFNSNPRRDSTRFAFWRENDGVLDPATGRSADWPISFRSVFAHVRKGRSCHEGTIVWPRAPRCSSWPAFKRGEPPSGDFVPATSDVGLRYGRR